MLANKKAIKLCKTCNKNERHTGRTECLSCIQKKEREKAKEKLAKDRADARINIRLSGVDETNREQVRDKIKEAIGPYLGKKQIQIKVSRGKSRSSKQKLRDKADDLWSEAVKVNYSHKCVYCGTSEGLNSHHIYTRSRTATRWDIDNGICLCANHHNFSQEFSAHKTPAKFHTWLVGVKGEDYVRDIEQKSLSICKVSEDMLQDAIEELSGFIETNTVS